MEGAQLGERTLYITLAETRDELISGAASHGWTLGDGVNVFELQPPESLLNPEQQQSLLYSSDLELGETVKLIFDEVERVHPSRIVIDSLSEIRLLAQSRCATRRRARHALPRGATVLAHRPPPTPWDKTAHSIAYGVVRPRSARPTIAYRRRRTRREVPRLPIVAATIHHPPAASTFPRLISTAPQPF
jgi:circadian clock protein KaiC